MKAILGRKLGMTRIFDPAGRAQAVTVIEAVPNTIVNVRTKEKDGYFAYALGAGEKKKPTRSISGQFKKIGFTPREIKEIRIRLDDVLNNEEDPSNAYEAGAKVGVDAFKPGDVIDVSGITKGKGFAGTVKRHNFNTGPKSHGSHNYRKVGSIGTMYPEHVTKGHKMPGRMGHNQRTVKNTKVVDIRLNDNLILVAGGVPGPRNSWILIRGRKEAVAQEQEQA